MRQSARTSPRNRRFLVHFRACRASSPRNLRLSGNSGPRCRRAIKDTRSSCFCLPIVARRGPPDRRITGFFVTFALMPVSAYVAGGLHLSCSGRPKPHSTLMPSSDVTSPSEISFDEAVRSRAWEWLVALQRRLNVDLHLVDEQYKPTLLPGTLQTTAVGRLLAAGSAPLQAAVAAALRTRTPHGVTLDGMQIVAVGLPAGQHARGALVLARTLAERGPAPQQVRGELELLGLWLSGAVAAHLASAPVGADGGDRLAVLARLLGDVAATGSDRDLVSRLADVLAVWHDIKLFGYVDTG